MTNLNGSLYFDKKYNNVAKKGKATIFYVYLSCFKIQVAVLKGAVAPWRMREPMKM